MSRLGTLGSFLKGMSTSNFVGIKNLNSVDISYISLSQKVKLYVPIQH